MSSPGPAPGRKYSYADYLTWDDGKRWELIDGEPYCMGSAPSRPSAMRRHQKVLGRLHIAVATFLGEGPCEVYLAPFDVRLTEHPRAGDEETVTVVQPDLVVVCDPAKLDERGCKGAPELVVEILSDSTAGRDLGEKRALYERHGVREYCVVNPWDRTITVHEFDPATRRFAAPRMAAPDGTLTCSVLPGLRVDVATVLAP